MALRFAKPQQLGKTGTASSGTAAHRVFAATIDDVRGGKLLAGAREGAIGELLVGERVAAREGEALHEGPFAAATLDAIEGVAAEVARTVDYEVRLLRIPALYLAAVWLHGDDEVLIPLSPTPPGVAANEPYDEARLVAALLPLIPERESLSPT